MVVAENLVVHRHERVDAPLVHDRLQMHALGGGHVERQLRDLGDEQGLGRLAREARRQQPRGQVRRLVV